MEKRVTYDNATPPSCQYPADRGHTARGRERGQGNFELAANSDYDSRGSADPRESLRRRRISKLALNAHLQNLPLAASSGCNATKCCVTQTPYLLGCFSYFLNFFNFCTY